MGFIMARLTRLMLALIMISINSSVIDAELKKSDIDLPSRVTLGFAFEPSSRVDFSNNTGTRIECRSAISASTISWTLVDGTIASNVTGLRLTDPVDGSLVFSPFGSESFRQDVHAATYRCVISSSSGTIVSRDVRVRAVMDVDYDSNVYDVFAIRGNTAVIKCHVPNFLEDFVSVVAYIKDDSLKIASPIQSDGKYSLSPNGALYIKEVGGDDSGTGYRCQTLPRLSGHMKTSSSIGRLFVNEPQGNVQPKIVDRASKVTVREGEVAALSCVAQGYPTPVTQWYLRSVVGDLALSTQNGARRKVNNGLIISKVQLSDSGIYVCRANNTLGSDHVEIALTVTAPLRVELKTRLLVVEVGGSLHLECIVGGFPVSSVWWLKNGRLVDKSRLQGSSGRPEFLDIKSVALEDKGMYQCFAGNDREIVQDITEVRLGEFAPVLLKTFAESILKPGDPLSLSCVFTGNPDPDVEWRLGTILMTTTSNRRMTIARRLDVEGNVVVALSLKDTSVTEDGGVYSCLASNLRGRTQYSARIDIHGPLGIREVPKATVVAGEDAAIYCPFYGYPYEKVTWKKESTLLPMNSRQVLHENGTLMIRKVQRKVDGGDYICSVADHKGRVIEGKLNVQVLVAPKISPFAFQEDLLREGMRARISCVISEGDSPLTTVWTKDMKPIVPSEALGVTFQAMDEYSSILAIGNVSPKHNGNYTCVVTNIAGSASHSARLYVNALPKIIPFAFQDDQNFKGMRAHIICAVSEGDLPLIFQWLKDGHKIAPNSTGGQIGVYDKHSSSLSFESVSSGHSGNYTCVAGNGAGKARFTAQLVVQVAPKIVPFSFHGDHLFEGVLARVSCVVYQGDLPLDIEWLKDGIPLSSRVGTSIDGLSIRKVDDYTSILTIDRVLSEKHSGNYSCVAKNSAAAVTHSARLLVMVPPKIVPFAFQADKELVVEGMFVRVSCVVSRGDLPLSITWTMEGRALESRLKSEADVTVRAMDMYSSVLSIDSVAPKHAGNYTCLARNAAATTSYTATLVVYVPPFWTKVPNMKVSVISGDDVVLDCQADGFPKPTITWLKSKNASVTALEPITESGNLALLRNGSLLIKVVEKAVSGKYFCKAANGIGEGLDRIVNVNVLNPPEIVLKSGNVTVVTGSPFTVTCTVSGDQPINVTWLINGKAVDVAAKKSRISVKRTVVTGGTFISELTVSKAAKADNAQFACRATNQYGNDESQTHVLVQGPPDAPHTVKVVDRGSRSAEIAWKPPFDGHSPILNYVVEYSPLGSEDDVSSTVVIGRVTQVVVSELKPSSVYKFAVFAENAVGRSETGGVAELSLAGEVPNGAPENVEVLSVDANTLRVSWQPPPKQTWNGNIRGYHVGHRVCGGGADDDSESHQSRPAIGSYEFELLEVPEGYDKGLSFTVSNLKEFTQYGVVVQAFNDQGKGPLSNEVLAMTSEGVPSVPPESVQCKTASPEKLVVTWNPLSAKSVTGILRGYRILYWPVQKRRYSDGEWRMNILNTSSTSETLTALSKYTNYSIQVLGYTLVGDGLASKPIHCQTLEDVPGAPEEVKVFPASTDSVVIAWRPPKDSNGVVTRYTILVKNISKGHESSTLSRFSVHGNLTFYKVRALKKNQRYQFTVVASSSNVGDGKPSTAVIGSPATESKVAPKCANFGGTIYVHAGQSVSLLCTAFGFPPPKQTWSFGGQEVVDFKKGAESGSLFIGDARAADAGNYTCKVVNDAGRDHLVHTLIVLFPPSPPTLLVSTSSATSVGLFWMQSTVGSNSPILGHVLHYKAAEFGAWHSVDLQPYLASYMLGGLSCGTTYRMYLVAVNEVGAGQPSDTVAVTTTGGVASVPLLAQLVKESTTRVVLRLDSWVTNGCPILYFAVEYKPKTLRSWSLVSDNLRPDKTELVINDLDPGSWYNLRMRAHTSAGSSVVEYEFSTLSVNEGTVSKEDFAEEPYVPLADLDLHVALPTALCVLVILLCLLVTCFWVKRKQRGGSERVSAMEGPLDRKKASKKGVNERGKHRSASDVNISNMRANRRGRLVGRSGSDDDIAPYATVKLSDVQRREHGKDRDNYSLPRDMSHTNNALPAWKHSSKPSGGPFTVQQAYNPSAPPMSDSNYNGMPGSYVNSRVKDRIRPIHEANAFPKAGICRYPLIPTEADDAMETTFVFPPPPEDLRDGDYDPPPPETSWLPKA